MRRQLTVPMTWCLSPEHDWLASVEGIHPNMLGKNVNSIKINWVKATSATWATPAPYWLAVDKFYRGQRNGELVHFYIDRSGYIERLTEHEFVQLVFERFENEFAKCDETDWDLLTWMEHGWSMSPQGSHCRQMGGVGKVVIHRKAGWIGSIFNSEANYHGPKRRTVEQAKRDVWKYVLEKRNGYPAPRVCAHCAAAEMENYL